MTLAFRTCLLLLAVCITPGCMFGSHTLKNSRTHYNRAIHRTSRQEMLLNLVRMKYRESVEFVKIPSITGQHTYSAGLGTRFATGHAHSYSPSFNAQSKPTIVYQPEQAQEFNRRLLTPISLVTLDLLTSKGWAADRVFRLTVRNINDVDNATSAGGPTPAYKPEFESFREVAQLIRQLQITRDVEITYEKLATEDPSQVSRSIDPKQVDGQDYLAAAQKGYEFRRSNNGKSVSLWTVPSKSSELVLRFSPRVHGSPQMKQIAQLLNLKRQDNVFYHRIKPDNFGQLNRPAKSHLRLDQTPELTPDMVVSTRSLKEMMFYLSHGIVTPKQHVESGLIMRTMIPLVDGGEEEFDWRDMTGDLFQVHFSKVRPTNASVSVHYRGHYFFINDTDLNSKATFNLVLELFNLEIRAGGGAQIPLLAI